MNRKQLWVMWVCIGIAVIMFLFPPWKYTFYYFIPGSETLRSIPVSASGPYRLIFLGPPNYVNFPYPKPAAAITLSKANWVVKDWNCELDWLRLLIPVALVIVVATGLIITFSKRKASPGGPQ